ncbi:SHD1 domain-containing protein [Verrucomicrobiota bacterium]
MTRRSCFLSMLVFATLIRTNSAYAEFQLPEGVFRLDDIDEAQAEAKAKHKPLTYLYSTLPCPCPFGQRDTLTFIKKLKKEAVIVLGMDHKKLPDIVTEPMNDMLRQAGGVALPVAFIVDAGATNVMYVIPNVSDREEKKHFREASKKIREYAEKAARRRSTNRTRSLSKSMRTIQYDETREMRTWTSRRGSEVSAALVEQKGGHVVLRKEDGSKLEILVSALSEKDQQYLTGLKEEEGSSGL